MTARRTHVALFITLIAARGFAQSAPSPLSPEDSIPTLLSALERVGKNLSSLKANVSLREVDPAVGDSTERRGTLILQKLPDGNTDLLVDFPKKIQDEKIFDDRIEWLLKDGKLTQRQHQKKEEIVRQLAQPGEKINPIKLGEGPFPLPIGQPASEVNEQFVVTKPEQAKRGWEKLIRLDLVPKPDTAMDGKFKSIFIGIDPITSMPAKIETLDKAGTTTRIATLKELQVNPSIDPKEFELPPVKGWDLHSE